MSSVTLSHLWLHDAGDYSDFARFKLRSLRERAVQQGQRRRYAGGRLRVVTRPGVSHDLDITLGYLTRTEVDELRSRIGTPQMLREPRGRLLFGVILDENISEWLGGDMVPFPSFVFHEITMSAEI